MNSAVRRLTAVAAGLALTSIGLTGAATTATAAKKPTKFMMSASGFASHVAGGKVPASTARTGYANFSCTNFAGKDKRGTIAGTEIPDPRKPSKLLIDIAAGKSHSWSEKHGKTVSVTSEHNIADVKLLAGAIKLKGVNSKSTAYNDGKRFGTRFKTTLGDISVAGSPHVKVPTPSHPVVVPGLARISIGSRISTVTKDGAVAKGTGLKIEILPTKTTVWLAYAQADLSSGIETALFSGSARGVTVSGLGGAVVSGPLPRAALPCEGSEDWRKAGVARVDVPGAVEVGAIDAAMLGRQDKARNSAVGAARVDVAQVTLGRGAVVIDGLRAEARVRLRNGEVTLNKATTSTAEITLNGKKISIGKLPKVEIPGIARIRTGIVTKPAWNQVKIIALRVEVLQGSKVANVIDIGTAEVVVKPSRL